MTPSTSNFSSAKYTSISLRCASETSADSYPLGQQQINGNPSITPSNLSRFGGAVLKESSPPERPPPKRFTPGWSCLDGARRVRRSFCFAPGSQGTYIHTIAAAGRCCCWRCLQLNSVLYPRASSTPMVRTHLPVLIIAVLML